MHDHVTDDLRRAYDQAAEEREQMEVSPWKVEERGLFLSMLKDEGKKSLLEIGAGPGTHGKFFQDHGLDVVCTDLSPELVKRCRAKGLEAREMDFLHLDLPESSFDAVFAMNSLLHAPRKDLSRVLANIRDLLKPGGLFFWGQYGGPDREGVWEEDHYEPRRFFSFLTDEHVQELAREVFDLLRFETIDYKQEESEFHFQSMILRRS